MYDLGRKNRFDRWQVEICGEHRGESNSVQFFHSLNFDYVSCNPLHVLIARISAGQAAVQEKLESQNQLYRESITSVKRVGKKSDEFVKQNKKPTPLLRSVGRGRSFFY